MDWYAKGHGGSKGLRQGWPAYRDDCVWDRITHQRYGLAEQKDLCVMAGLRQRVCMQEWKGRLGRIIRAPSALYQHLHVRAQRMDRPLQRGEQAAVGGIREFDRCRAVVALALIAGAPSNTARGGAVDCPDR